MIKRQISATRSTAGGLILGVFTALFLSILWLVNLLPFRWKLTLGKSLGKILYRISSSRVNVARVNISLCFPDMPDHQVDELVKQSFQNFGAGIIETAMSWWDDPKKIHAITEIQGQEYMEQALAEGKGVLLLGAHFSTLDLSGMMFAKYFKVHAVYREQTNRVLNYVMQRGRLRNVEDIFIPTFVDAGHCQANQGWEYCLVCPGSGYGR